MLPRGSGLAGLLLGVALSLILKYDVHVNAVVWITADSLGRKTAFDIAADHPAMQAQGTEARLWTQTEYFLKEEKELNQPRQQGTMGRPPSRRARRNKQGRLRSPPRPRRAMMRRRRYRERWDTIEDDGYPVAAHRRRRRLQRRRGSFRSPPRRGGRRGRRREFFGDYFVSISLFVIFICPQACRQAHSPLYSVNNSTKTYGYIVAPRDRGFCRFGTDK